MCELNKSNAGRRIDPCMRGLILNITHFFIKDITVVACCCGHKRYPMTVLVKDKYGNVWDIFSNQFIKRKKKYYRRDVYGYYYVPETLGSLQDTKIDRYKKIEATFK